MVATAPSSRPTPHARRALTLVELLVSVTLAMFLMSVAWTMFSQVQRLVKRTQARLHLHASAKTIYESLRRDLTAMQQSCSFWLLSSNAMGGTPGSIDVVFMTAVADEEGFRLAAHNQFDMPPVTTTDLVWCRWSWSGSSRTLLAARNDTVRSFYRKQFGDPAPNRSGIAYDLLGRYRNPTPYNPQPRRFTPSDDVLGLDDNRWSFTERAGFNRGDWTDLDQRLAPVHNAVTDCTIEVVLAGDGTGGAPALRRADGRSTLAFCARGVRLDGLSEKVLTDGVSTRDEVAERPSLLRIAFTLEDRATRVSEDFSFTIALPGAIRHF